MLVGWAAGAAGKKVLRKSMIRAVRRLINHSQAIALGSWVAGVTERRRLRLVMSSAVLRLGNHLQSAAMDCWAADVADKSRRQSAAMVLAAARMRSCANATAMSAITSWAAGIAQLREARREAMGRTVALMLGRVVGPAWAGWVQATARIQRLKQASLGFCWKHAGDICWSIGLCFGLP